MTFIKAVLKSNNYGSHVFLSSIQVVEENVMHFLLGI